MQSREPVNVQRAWSGPRPNASTGQAVDPKHGRASSGKFLVASARAVRPASLAASAMPERLEAKAHSTSEPALRIDQPKVQSIHGRSASSPSVGHRKKAPVRIRRSGLPVQTRTQRLGQGQVQQPAGSGAAPASARFASGATQRTMRAGSVPQSALLAFNFEVQHPADGGRLPPVS